MSFIFEKTNHYTKMQRISKFEFKIPVFWLFRVVSQAKTNYQYEPVYKIGT